MVLLVGLICSCSKADEDVIPDKKDVLKTQYEELMEADLSNLVFDKVEDNRTYYILVCPVYTYQIVMNNYSDDSSGVYLIQNTTLNLPVVWLFMMEGTTEYTNKEIKDIMDKFRNFNHNKN